MDRVVEVTATEQNLEKRMKIKKKKWWHLWDNIEHTNIHIVGVPEGEGEKGPEKIFIEIIAENSANMGKEIVNQLQEAQSPR